MSLFKSPNTRLAAGARKVYLPDFSKGMFLKSKIKNVVKYDLYLDILLTVSIYVTKHILFKENHKFLSSCKPRHPGLGLHRTLLGNLRIVT